MKIVGVCSSEYNSAKCHSVILPAVERYYASVVLLSVILFNAVRVNVNSPKRHYVKFCVLFVSMLFF